jgi:hypothetical protein
LPFWNLLRSRVMMDLNDELRGDNYDGRLSGDYDGR